jgi:hypothetical protein
MNIVRLGSAAIVFLTLAACSEGSGPGTTLVTRIERASLDSTRLLQVAFTVTNVGSVNKDVPACGGRPAPVLQQQRDARWDNFGGGICPANLSSVPIALASGASVSGTVGVAHAEAGIYRLVVSFSVDGSVQAMSNPFAVH